MTAAPEVHPAPRRERNAGTLDAKVDAFRRRAYRLKLDTGERWELEDFQIEIVRDVLAGFVEVWGVIPEGNAKTTLVAGIAVDHLDQHPNPSIPVAASSRDQAKILFNQAARFIEGCAELAEKFRCLHGYRHITYRGHKQELLKVFAADSEKADGIIPTLALVDELHRHRDLSLYRTWRGKLKKRNGQLIVISTAGEPGSEFEETRASRLRSGTRTADGAYVRAERGRTVIHDWAVRDRGKAHDYGAVKEANPLAAITVSDLAEKHEDLSDSDQTEGHWLRLTCNIASRTDGQAITEQAWDAMAEPDLEPDRAAWSIGWLDLGWRIDCTALGVLIWERDDRRVIAGVTILEPPVHEDAIVRALLAADAEFHPAGWVYDPNAGGQQMAQQLEAGNHHLQTEGSEPITWIEHSQDNAPMSLAASRLDEVIRNAWLVHDGNRTLRAHALNAVRHELGAEKWKYDRPKDAKGERRRKYPIDGLTGLSMGNSVAVDQHDDQSVYEKKDLVAI